MSKATRQTITIVLGVCLAVAAWGDKAESATGTLDTVRPTVERITFLSDQSIEVTFSEVMLETGLSDPKNYTVSGVGATRLSPHPDSVSGGNPATLTWFSGQFYGNPVTLTVTDLQDAVGNPIAPAANSASALGPGPKLALRWWPAALALLLCGIILLVLRRNRVARIPFFICFAALTATAQTGEVSSVVFTQQPNGAGGTEVRITYDLEAPSPTNILVTFSKNNGLDGYPYPATAISGAVSNVTTGTDHVIVWDVAHDYPAEQIARARLRVATAPAEGDYAPWQAPFPLWIGSNASGCTNNLKLLGLRCRLFVDQNAQEIYPRLSGEPGRLAMVVEELYPRYVCGPEVFQCPGRAEETPPPGIENDHYVYLGYLVTNDKDASAFASAYATEIASGGGFLGDLAVATSYGDTLYRLRKGVERILITDINDPLASVLVQSEIPVMFDWPDNHQESWGGNVLYLDGHVEFKPYPGEFPMTETAIGIFAEITGYVPPREWRTPDPSSPYSETNDPHGFVHDCATALKHFGIIQKMFANEGLGNRYPLLSSEPGRLMMTEAEKYPEYLWDKNRFRCPGSAPVAPSPDFDDRHYLYFGYLLPNPEDVASFAEAYEARIAEGGDFSTDLPAETSYYGDTLYLLREGVERFLITDINSPVAPWCAQNSIPTMMEWPGNHKGLAGGHVLYMDGHVEWHDFPGEFPMDEATVATLDSIAGWNPTTDWAQPHPKDTPEGDPFGFITACRENLSQLGFSYKIFANESQSRWPRISNTPGTLMMAEDELYPDYLADPSKLLCPGVGAPRPTTHFDDDHYLYFGYVLTNDQDLTAFAAAYAAEVANGGDFSQDLPATTSYGASLYRLREGVERLLGDSGFYPPASAQADIPVMMEWPGHHEGFSGGHVLYMDGHIEWYDYPGEFPMTEAAVATLDALANWSRTIGWASRDFTLANDPRKQALCEQNLLHMQLAFTGFTLQYRDYPPLANADGKLTFALENFVPYHLGDLRRLNCPGAPIAFNQPDDDDQSYVYLGYMLVDDADVQAFARAYKARLRAGGDFSEALDAPMSYGSTMRRITYFYEGRSVLSYPASASEGYTGAHTIPVIVEWPDNHGMPLGGNVLFGDRHVEWIPYPGKFPMTPATMAVLTELAGRPPIE